MLQTLTASLGYRNRKQVYYSLHVRLRLRSEGIHFLLMFSSCPVDLNSFSKTCTYFISKKTFYESERVSSRVWDIFFWYFASPVIRPLFCNIQGKLTYGKIGEWRFDKRSYTATWPPRNLPMPPPGVPESVVSHRSCVSEGSPYNSTRSTILLVIKCFLFICE